MRVKFLPLFAVFLVAGTAAAADWPQWRGPDRNDVSKEKGLLHTWPKEGPKLLWTFHEAGAGFSGPAIVGDRLYTMGGDPETKKEFVYALDLKTQKKVWSVEVAPYFKHGNGDGPRATPTVDGSFLYCLLGHGELLCLDTATGKIVWQKNLKDDPKKGGLGGQMASGWGYSESVLVDGDKVVCTPGGKGGTIAAFDKKTGDLLWRSKEWTAPAVYSSIVVAEIGGVRQYVQVTGQGVGAVSAADGKLLWTSDVIKHGISVSTPVVSENHVYITTGYGVGCALVKVTAEKDGFKAEKVYANKEMVNHHGGVIKLGDYIYGHSDKGGWKAMEFMTGTVPEGWNKGKKIGKGSVTFADGRLYCYSESDGTVALVEPSPEGWIEKGLFKIPQRTKLSINRGSVWTHPVVANGKLYLRDHDLLFCYDVSDSKSSE